MSFPFYGKMWIATKQQLNDAALCEQVLKQLEPTMDRNLAHHLIGNIYARYLILCNNLSELYDQTLQAQKRPLIEKLMISIKQRWLELLKDIEKIEMSQYVYVDDAIVELCLVPQDIQFLRPFYFPRRRDIDCQKLIDEGPKVEEVIDEATLKIPAKFRKIFTPEELEEKRRKEEIKKAVNLIKAHEKAKQGRIKAFHIKGMQNILLPFNLIYYFFFTEFPVELKPKPHKDQNPIVYEFSHKDDQIPMYKIKRTNYKFDLFSPLINFDIYDYYEPPEFNVNRHGHKTLIPKNKKIIEIQKEKINESFANSILGENTFKNI